MLSLVFALRLSNACARAHTHAYAHSSGDIADGSMGDACAHGSGGDIGALRNVGTTGTDGDSGSGVGGVIIGAAGADCGTSVSPGSGTSAGADATGIVGAGAGDISGAGAGA
eukprot:6195745-Pleurochrysis_carterae.AAC.1